MLTYSTPQYTTSRRHILRPCSLVFAPFFYLAAEEGACARAGVGGVLAADGAELGRGVRRRAHPGGQVVGDVGGVGVLDQNLRQVPPLAARRGLGPFGGGGR